jgi:hypothetical protein
MSDKITLQEITTLQNQNSAIAALNANFELIAEKLDTLLSRDGDSPNQMEANLDMNSNRINNLPAPVNTTEPARLAEIQELVSGGIPEGSLDGDRITANTLPGNRVEDNTLDGDKILDASIPTGKLENNSVTVAKMQQLAGLSVLGRSANSTGDMAAITAGTDGHVLTRSGSSLVFAAPALNFTPTGTGAVTRTVNAKLAEASVSIVDYGGVGDDSTNNDTAFTDATNYLNSRGGGTLFIPEGTYRVSSALTLPGGVGLLGEGYYSVIKTTHATNNIINCSGNQMITNLRFGTSVTRTGGFAINTDNAGNVIIHNNEFIDFINTICLGSASSLTWVTNNRIYTKADTNAVGILVDGAVIGNDQYIYDNFIRSLLEATQPQAGIKIVNTGAIWLRDNSVLWCGNGLLIQPTSGKKVEWLFDKGSAYDQGTGHGVLIDASSGGVVKGAQFIGTWTSSNDENGFTTGSGAGTIDGVELIGHRSLFNAKHGISVLGGVETHVRACTTSGNNASAGSYDGINIAANVSEFSVTGCRSGASLGFGGSQRYGIRVETGASDNYILALNDCRDNTTGGLSDGGSGSTKQVATNIP